MGGICTRAKSTTAYTAESGAAGRASELPGCSAPTTRAETAKASEQGVSVKAHDPTVPTAEAAANAGVSTTNGGGAASDLDAFTLGEGCGVYLVEEKSLNGTLVTQYAKERPSAEEGLILLQIKPPPYNPIPPSRFTLQGGRRVLKQNIEASTKNRTGKGAYCSLVVDFIRLSETYTGFLWVSTHLDEAIQPLTIFTLKTKQRTSAVAALKRGTTAASGPSGDSEQQNGGPAGESGEPQVPDKKEETGIFRQTSEEQSQPGAGGTDDAAPEEPTGSSAEKDNGKLYVQYMEGGSALPCRLLERVGVLPLPWEKATEILPPWTEVESLEDIRKTVTGVGGVLWLKNPAS